MGPGRSSRAAWAACLAIPLLAAMILHAMGRPLWCACGSPWPWSGTVASRHNSQHLFDPYSFSHLSHGILLAWLVRALLGRRARSPAGWALALALESAWEVVENTDVVIRRYREATIALDYYGDSVANSLGDVLAMALGYAAAVRLSWRAGAALLVVLEIALALWIHDGLVLNVVMLLWPIAAVRAWQTGT